MRKLLMLVILIVCTVSSFGKNLEFKFHGVVGDEPLQSVVELLDGSILVAADHGLFKSTDMGQTWDLLEYFQKDTNVYKLKLLKNGSVLASTYSGLFRSDDNGSNWKELRIRTDTMVKNYFYNNKKNMLYSILDSNLYYSSDNGDNWEIFLSKESLPKSFGSFIETDKGYFFCISRDNNNNKNLMYSKDRGVHWNLIDYSRENLEGDINKLFYIGGDTIYGVGSQYNYSSLGKIYFLNDSAIFELSINPVSDVYNMARDSIGNIYLGTRKGLFKYNPNTNDIDSVFQLIVNIGEYWDEKVSIINEIFINSTNDIYFAHVTGIYLSKDTGTNCEKIFSASENMNKPFYNGSGLIELQNGELLLTYNRDFYKTDFNRKYWKFIETNLRGTRVRGYTVTHFTTDKKGKVYAFYDSLGLFISIDNGTTWSRIDSTTFSFYAVVNSFIDNNNAMYVGTYDGLYETTDEGYTWTKHLFFNNKLINAITGFSQDTIIVSLKKELYISYNHGTNWNLLKRFDTDYDINIIRINSKGELFVCVGPLIYRYSLDKWEQITKGFEGGELWELIITRDDALIAGTKDGILFSNLNGNYWDYEKDYYSADRYFIESLLVTNDNKLFLKHYYSVEYAEISKKPMTMPGWIDKVDYLEQNRQISYINYIRYSKDGNFIFTNDSKEHLYKWDVSTGTMLKDIYLPYYRFCEIVLDDKTIILSDPDHLYSPDSTVMLFFYDSERDSIARNLNIHLGEEDSLVYIYDYVKVFSLPDNKLITSFKTGKINQTSLWDLKTGNNLKCINNLNSEKPVIFRKIEPDLFAFLYLSKNINSDNPIDTFFIMLYDINLSNPRCIYKLEFSNEKYNPFNSNYEIVKNPIQNTLILSINNDDILIFDLDSYTQINKIPLRDLSSETQPLSLIFSVDCKYLIGYVFDLNRKEYVKFYNVETNTIDEQYKFNEQYYHFSKSPNSKDIALGADSGYVRILKPRVLNPEFHANFTSDSAFVIKNEPQQFYDISNGNPVWWVWDFGDGTGSDKQNPIHNYKKSGDYTVKLIATDGNKIDSVIKDNYVVVKSPLLVDFTASPKIGNFPLDVQFHDKSIGDEYFYRHWNFGDGSDDWGSIISHRFGDPGIYKVTLTIDDEYFTKSKSDTIIVLDTVTSIYEINNEISASIYPNPAADFLIVSFSVDQPTSVNVTLSDMIGNKVYNLENEFIESGYQNKKLDVSNLENGIYFLKISVGGRDKIFKVAVLR